MLAKRKTAAAVAAAALILAAPAVASATCPNTVGASADLDAIDEAARLQFIRSNLEVEAGRARLWTWGWAGAGAAGTTVNAVLATQGNYSERVDRIGAASGTTMLTLTTLISPLSVPTADAGEGDKNDPCAAVVRAEKVLASVAQDEADRQRFVMHLIPIGGSIAGGVVLGLGYDHWLGGAVNAGIGIVVSELKMLSQPMGAVRTLERYRSGVLTNDGPKLGWNVSPTVGKGGGGLALSLTY